MTQDTYLGITIDFSRDKLFDELGLLRLKESYMRDEETSPQQRYAFVAKQFGSNQEHSQRLYEYASKHWLSFSTPILSFGRSKGGLPISCFANFIEDTRKGLVDNLSETNWLSMMGGGVGIHFDIRGADEKSAGVMPHLKIYDASSLAYRQGKTRRGSYAAYLDISHPDIIQFIEMRKPTGDQNLKALNLHHGINITDDFMKIIEECMINPDADDSWQLKTPAGDVVETVSAKYLWQLILETRIATGEPYLFFIDTANKALPKTQRDLGLKIQGSNICTEIVLPTDKERTFVCCLSSLNLNHFDDWKNDEQFISDVVEMLDNVLTYFIDNAPDAISRARYSAMRERAIGIGVLGFHAYLQKHMIPFDCAMAKVNNKKIFKHIKKHTDEANYRLGKERGEAPDMKGTGKRFSHTEAIAPTASTSIIMGNTSPSIEPYKANAYRQDTLSGSHLNKNHYLDALIKKKCEADTKLNCDDIWSDIISSDGSVQHLKFLSQEEKDVFKTAMELDQRWIIEHASDRQEFIDQAQSINVFFRPDVNIKYLHMIHYLGWKNGLKSLYYCRSESVGKADKISKQIERQIIKEVSSEALVNNEECIACQ